MIFYHGTADVYLPSILKEGLKPTPENQWKGTWPSGSNIAATEESGVVYLARLKESAKDMAIRRAKYLSVKPGESFGIGSPFIKGNAPVIRANPVILRVSLLASDKIYMSRDPHFDYDDEMNGWMYRGVIPPEKIVVLTKKSK